MKLSNETWAGAIEMQLQYSVTCQPCGRSVDIEMEKMPRDGPAVGITFTCSRCGRKNIPLLSAIAAALNSDGEVGEMTDDSRTSQPEASFHVNHWCEQPGCKAWGGFGFQRARVEKPVWKCWEHNEHKPEASEENAHEI
jgi:transcription elongation factor Elf1